jgi:hypothetical protein
MPTAKQSLGHAVQNEKNEKIVWMCYVCGGREVLKIGGARQRQLRSTSPTRSASEFIGSSQRLRRQQARK